MAIRGVHPGRAKALATEEHLTNFPEEQIIAAVRHRSASSVAATIRSASSVAFLARLAKLEVPTEEGMAMAVPTEEEEEEVAQIARMALPSSVHPGRAKALATEEYLTIQPRHRSASSVPFLARLAELEVPTEEGMAMAVPTEEEEEKDEDGDEQNNDQRRRKEKRETTTRRRRAD